MSAFVAFVALLCKKLLV
jgi:uncharacterized protein